MSLAEIEAELEKLSPDELRHLALKSWSVFVEKEGHSPIRNECVEDDPALLEALDEAVSKADTTPGGYSAAEVRERLGVPHASETLNPQPTTLNQSMLHASCFSGGKM